MAGSRSGGRVGSDALLSHTGLRLAKKPHSGYFDARWGWSTFRQCVSLREDVSRGSDTAARRFRNRGARRCREEGVSRVAAVAERAASGCARTPPTARSLEARQAAPAAQADHLSPAPAPFRRRTRVAASDPRHAPASRGRHWPCSSTTAPRAPPPRPPPVSPPAFSVFSRFRFFAFCVENKARIAETPVYKTSIRQFIQLNEFVKNLRTRTKWGNYIVDSTGAERAVFEFLLA